MILKNAGSYYVQYVHSYKHTSHSCNYAAIKKIGNLGYFQIQIPQKY